MPKVLKEFVDKDTNTLYVPGAEYEGSKSRLKTLEKLEYVEASEEKQEKKSSKDGE
jgi:hypothetical protein